MNKVKLFISIIAVVFMISSCTKSGFPEINNLELGLENSKTAYLGQDFHFEAEIVAEKYIQKIEIEIHDEQLDAGQTNPTWEYTNVIIYSDNLKNVLLHEHIDVPSNVATGEYHIHISVTDKEGNQTEKEVHIDVVK